MHNDFLTAEQIAKRLSVSPRTVRSWRLAGIIPAIRLTNKVVRYDLDEVITALKDRQSTKDLRATE